MGPKRTGPRPFDGLGTSPRARAASASWTHTGHSRSDRSRSANPMWSLWPWVSTSARTSSTVRPIAASSRRDVRVVAGHARVHDGHGPAIVDEVGVDRYRCRGGGSTVRCARDPGC